VSAEFVDYNPRIERHIGKLVGILETKAGQEKEVNFSKLMDNLVFDMYVHTLRKMHTIGFGA